MQPIIIAGPCVIESEEMVLSIAKQMKAITDELGITYTFKASFDKANRTSISGFRGPGIEEGLRILQKVKDTYDLPIFFDHIHLMYYVNSNNLHYVVLFYFVLIILLYQKIKKKEN